MTPAIIEPETYTEDAIHAAKVTLYIEGCLVLAIMVMAFALLSFDGTTNSLPNGTSLQYSDSRAR